MIGNASCKDFRFVTCLMAVMSHGVNWIAV